MLLYKAEGTVKSGVEYVVRPRSECEIFLQVSDTFYFEYGKKIYIFVSMLRQSKIGIGVITEEPCDIEKYVAKFLESMEIDADFAVSEVTLSAFNNMANSASRMGFIPDADYIRCERNKCDLSC